MLDLTAEQRQLAKWNPLPDKLRSMVADMNTRPHPARPVDLSRPGFHTLHKGQRERILSGLFLLHQDAAKTAPWSVTAYRYRRQNTKPDPRCRCSPGRLA